LLDVLKRMARRSSESHAKDSGAAIAYYAFFSLFPLLIGVLSVAGFFFDSVRAQEEIFAIVDEVMPGSAALVQDNLQAVVASRGTLGFIGILGLLWSGSAAFGAINRAVNRAWGVRSPRHAIVARIRYFVMTIAAVVLMTVSVGLTALAEVVPRVGSRHLARLGIDASAVAQLPGWSMGLVVMFVMFALIYKTAPDATTAWKQVLPGAVLAAVLFELGKAGFVLYLDRFADYSVYGSVGSIIVLMLWFYFSARVLVLGAQLSAVLGEGDAGQ
jgi:membrane protein